MKNSSGNLVWLLLIPLLLPLSQQSFAGNGQNIPVLGSAALADYDCTCAVIV